MIDRDLIGRPYGKEFLKKEVNNVTSFCTILFENINCYNPEYFGDEEVDKNYIIRNIRNYTYNKRIPSLANVSNGFLKTLQLVIATYNLYSDKIPNCASLLAWVMANVESGNITIIEGCPKIETIDKDMNCIKEFFEYIDEVRTAYYYGTNPSRNIIPPIYTGSSAENLYKNDTISELKNMFIENIREDTYEYISSKGIEFNLERMCCNYNFYKDIIEYKLNDTEDFSWNLESELVKFYNMPNDEDVLVECVDCKTLPLEMALHVSYMMECKITVSYLNRENKVTIFEFNNGVPKVIKNKEKKAKFISRLLLNVNKSKFNKEALSNFILSEFGSKEKFDVFGHDIGKILDSKFGIKMDSGKKKKLYKKKLFTKVINN